jgi:hypothetical protein
VTSRKSTAGQPDGNARAWTNLGVVSQQLGLFPRALASYRRALASEGSDAPTIHFNIGKAGCPGREARTRALPLPRRRPREPPGSPADRRCRRTSGEATTPWRRFGGRSSSAPPTSRRMHRGGGAPPRGAQPRCGRMSQARRGRGSVQREGSALRSRWGISSAQGRADAGAGVGQGRGHPRGCASAAPGLCGGAVPPRLCALKCEFPPGALPPRPAQPRRAGPAAAPHAPTPRRSRRGSASRARWRASAQPCARAWGAVRRRASSLMLHSHSPGTRASCCRSRATTPRPARRRRTRVGVRPGVRRGAARQAHAPGSRGRAEEAVARAAAGVAAAARGVQELRHRRPPVVVPRLRAAPDTRLAGPPPLLARVPPAARRERAAQTDPGVRPAPPRAARCGGS